MSKNVADINTARAADIYARFCKMCDMPDPAKFPAPEKIPCSEFSDFERLCQRPLVSVLRTTYNHERWIRQAIEGVICQQTDFEYELIVGDDASTDATFKICLECQRKYPDKIRVLWASENVYSINGNSRRIRHRARGKYVAFCEGDDYWCDSGKLQKQINLIRKNNAIGCVGYYRILNQKGGEIVKMPPGEDILSIPNLHYFHTATYVFKKECIDAFPDIRLWYDAVLLKSMVSYGRVCLLREPVSVYRQTGEGAWTGANHCKQRLMILRQNIDLWAHGSRHSSYFHYVCARSIFKEIVRLSRDKDNDCQMFAKWHRDELRSILDEVWRDLPILRRISIILYRLRRP